mgnify:CR=1 FL=1
MKPRCLISDRDPSHAAELAALVKACGFSVDTLEPGARPDMARYDLLVLDLPGDDQPDLLAMLNPDLIQDTEVFVMTDVDVPEVADRAIRLGASYYFCKPANETNLRPLFEDIATEAGSVDTDVSEHDGCNVDQFGMLRGSSRGMRKLYRQVRKVAQSELSVFIVGESGTGKELVALTTHLMSERRDGPYVAFNCAAVPEGLAESELFGHEKGAFSGATQRHRGYFERARGGTLLLDEITEMDIDLQAKLLRVLETRTLRRLGSEEVMDLDVRVISACNRAPEEAVQDGKLREDLFYRLAQFPLHVPPLRRRGADIVGLAQYFLRELNEKHDTSLVLQGEAVAAMEAYDWPGNVRELRHLVERAYIMSETSIDAELEQAIREQADGAPAAQDGIRLRVGTTIAEMERQLILATLEHTGDDKTAAAELLGVSVKTLYNRLKAYAES